MILFFKDVKQIQLLTKRLSRIEDVRRFDNGDEPEYWKIAYTFSDLERSFTKFMVKQLPLLLRNKITDNEKKELLYQIGDVKYRYTGQEYDGQTGIYNYRDRAYDQSLGRFYATDPAGQSFSPYGYAANNPLSFVDPTGRVTYDVWYRAQIEMNRTYEGPPVHIRVTFPGSESRYERFVDADYDSWENKLNDVLYEGMGNGVSLEKAAGGYYVDLQYSVSYRVNGTGEEKDGKWVVTYAGTGSKTWTERIFVQDRLSRNSEHVLTQGLTVGAALGLGFGLSAGVAMDPINRQQKGYFDVSLKFGLAAFAGVQIGYYRTSLSHINNQFSLMPKGVTVTGIDWGGMEMTVGDGTVQGGAFNYGFGVEASGSYPALRIATPKIRISPMLFNAVGYNFR